MAGRLKLRGDNIYLADPGSPVTVEVASGGSSDALNPDGTLTALKASPSVVSVQSFIGSEELFVGSGFVVESIKTEGERYVSYVATAASLLASPSESDAALPYDIRVQIYMSDGKLLDGEVSTSMVDFHYNLAVIKVMSETCIPVLTLRKLDVFVPMVGNFQGDSKPFIRHCDLRGEEKSYDSRQQFNLHPGDQVVAVGRSCYCFSLMVEVGQFSVLSCTLDCKELMMTSCSIERDFIGGPLLNSNGEVIGINFSHLGYAAFLPTNIVLRCLKGLKNNEHVRRPCYGIELADLYTAEVAILERIFQKFPDTCGGVIVEKVKADSPAERAGLMPMDVIIQCDGSTISCSLEFFEMMWEKTGEFVELLVKRINGESLGFIMVVEESKAR